MKNLILTLLTVLASIGVVTIFLKLLTLFEWLKDLGNAFINKYKR